MASIKISSAYRFVEAFVDQRIFVGVDVHKKTFSVALLRPDGMIKPKSSGGVSLKPSSAETGRRLTPKMVRMGTA